MGNPPERPVLFLSGLSLHQLPIAIGGSADRPMLACGRFLGL